MKKSVFKISSFFLILGLYGISIICNSQDVKLNKKEKKEARKAERLKDYEALGTMLESRKFVFAVDRVQSTTGAKISHVIRLDGLRILVALDNPKNTSGRFSGATDNSTPSIGTTGLFFEGDIGRWELTKNSKNLSYSTEFEVNRTGSYGDVYEIIMNIHADKSASVEIKSLGGSNIYANYAGQIREY